MHLAVLTENPKFTLILSWLGSNNIPYSVHLNRTRFHLDTSNKLYTVFMLLYSECVYQVDENQDLSTDILLTEIP